MEPIPTINVQPAIDQVQAMPGSFIVWAKTQPVTISIGDTVFSTEVLPLALFVVFIVVMGLIFLGLLVAVVRTVRDS